MRQRLSSFLSRRRFEVLALAIALVLCRVHWQADTQSLRQRQQDLVFRALHILEGRATDLQFRLRGPIAPHPDVVVAVVDERSVQKYGLWPWPRDRIAQALRAMHRAGVAAIGMDMFFPDEVKDSANAAYADALKHLDETLHSVRPEVATQLAAYRESLAGWTRRSPDAELARAFAEIPEVVLGVVPYPESDREGFRSREQEFAELIEPAMLRRFPAENGISTFDVSLDELKVWSNYLAQMPLAVFARAGKHFAHFSVELDEDGILRRMPLLTRLTRVQGLLPGLALQTAAVALGAQVEPAFDPEQGKLKGAWLRRPGQPPRLVPVEYTDRMTLVNHLGRHEVFQQVSLSDVIDGHFRPEQLKGKAVLLGVNLVGFFDQRATPFNENEAGIYTHAALLSNILSGEYLTRPPSLRLLEFLFMLGSALLLARVLPRARFAWKLLTVVLAAAGWFALDQYLLVHQRLQLATVLPLTNVFVSSFGVIFLSYLSVDREKSVLRSAFRHYLNESVMEQMLRHPDRLKLGGEKREMTVLFSDIRGFTTLSERMTPEALVKFINTYLTPMTRIVLEEGGTLDKYIGDALMAFWGAPIEQPDHALRACRAAVRFLEKLAELKLAWRDQNLPEFDIGVGINTGSMIVGNMGSEVRFDYTVMGDAVNLASRLEGTNKEYETRLLISEATYEQVKGQVVARRLGAVRVKGKRKPVQIYELRAIGPASERDAEAIAAFDRAVDSYIEGKFEQSEGLLQQVLAIWPADPPSCRYLREIAVLKHQPLPSAWDGVYTATSK